jgi:hypothetical protein
LVKTWLYFAFAATPDRLPDFGWRADGAPSAARLVVFLGAASLPMLVALALGWRDAERRAARNLLLWLSGVSLALLAGALLAQPLFDPRHALLLMPPALALAARGLDRGFERSRALGAALLLAVLAPMLLALQQERVDPRYARQDWRGAAQAVCRDRRPGDAAFAFHEEKAYSFAHYASACDLRVDPLFDDEVLAMDLDKRRDHLRRRLANLTAGAVRLWLIDYHGAIYDPAGDAWRELSALGYRHIRRTAYDRGVKRFAIDLFTRDQAEARAADAAAVDFAGAFNPSQLLDGWRPPGDQGAWIGPRAAVRLARSSETAIEATAYVHRPFYRGPVTVRLLVGNEPVAAKTTNEAALLRICGPLPASALAGDSVEAAITVDPTFVPADVLPTQDREPKGALVQRIGLGLTAPPDCP